MKRVACLLVAVLLAGCGGGSPTRLETAADALAAAARSGDPAKTRTAMAELQAALAAAQLQPDQAREVLAAARRVMADVPGAVVTPKPTPSPTPVVTRAPVVQRDDDDTPEPRRKGKGKKHDD